MTCPLNWWSWKSVWWIKLVPLYNCVSTLKKRGPSCFLFKRLCLETSFPSFSIVYKKLPNARSLSNTILMILSAKGVSTVLFFFYIVRCRGDNKAGIFWEHFLRPVDQKTKREIRFVQVWYAWQYTLWYETICQEKTSDVKQIADILSTHVSSHMENFLLTKIPKIIRNTA